MTLLLLAFLLGGDGWNLTVNSDSFATHERDPLLDQGELLMASRLRLSVRRDFAEHWQWEGAYEAQWFYRDQLLLPRLPVHLRVDDINAEVHTGDDQLLLQQLDRLRLTWNQGPWRLTLGRQPVGHGNGRFFNPSDLFAPLSPYSLNTQYKAGIDGLRLTRRLSERNEIELLSFYPEQGEGVHLLHLATHLGAVDASFLAGQTYGEWTLAWDFAGIVWDAAWYSEGLWRDAEQRADPLRLAAGITNRLGPRTDLTVEVHHQNRPIESIFDILTRPEFRHGELYLLSGNHLAAMVTQEVHPLVRLSATVLTEFHDHSARYLLSLSWDLSQRSTLAAGYLLPQGGQTTEFGASSQSAYAEFRLTLP